MIHFYLQLLSDYARGDRNQGRQLPSSAMESVNNNNNSTNHKRNFSSSNQSSSSGHSSVVTSPDFIDQGLTMTPASRQGDGGSNDLVSAIPNMLQPVATFLEHAQINKANNSQQQQQQQQQSSESDVTRQNTKNLSERLKRVVDTLLKLRETVNDKALRHLKDTFETTLLKGTHMKTTSRFHLKSSLIVKPLIARSMIYFGCYFVRFYVYVKLLFIINV